MIFLANSIGFLSFSLHLHLAEDASLTLTLFDSHFISRNRLGPNIKGVWGKIHAKTASFLPFKSFFSVIFSQFSPRWGRIVDPHFFLLLEIDWGQIWKVYGVKTMQKPEVFSHLSRFFWPFLSIFSSLRTHRWPTRFFTSRNRFGPNIKGVWGECHAKNRSF